MACVWTDCDKEEIEVWKVCGSGDAIKERVTSVILICSLWICSDDVVTVEYCSSSTTLSAACWLRAGSSLLVSWQSTSWQATQNFNPDLSYKKASFSQRFYEFWTHK